MQADHRQLGPSKLMRALNFILMSPVRPQGFTKMGTMLWPLKVQ